MAHVVRKRRVRLVDQERGASQPPCLSIGNHICVLMLAFSTHSQGVVGPDMVDAGRQDARCLTQVSAEFAEGGSLHVCIVPPIESQHSWEVRTLRFL